LSRLARGACVVPVAGREVSILAGERTQAPLAALVDASVR
jgi:hypothetical protein